MTPLRVAMLTLYPQDPTHIAGGVRAVSHNLVQGLQALPDLELHVLHCHGDIREARVIRQGNTTVHFIAVPTLRLIPNMTIAIHRLRHALNALQPDVVHAHIAQYAAAASGAPYPWLYTIHGVARKEAHAYDNSLFDRLRYALYARYDALAVRRARHLVAISDYVQQAYSGMTDATWHRIDNPLTNDFFLAGQWADPDPKRILFVGSITEVKDIATLLRAFHRVHSRQPMAHLTLAGRITSSAYYETLQRYVKDQGLSDSVTFAGPLDRQRLLRAYAESAVVALSSVQENTPMAIIEAMAVGRAVVATRVGGIPELVQEGQTGHLVEPGDDHALAARLTALVAAPERCRQMGQRGREIATARFGLDRVAAQYADLYREIAAQAEGMRP